MENKHFNSLFDAGFIGEFSTPNSAGTRKVRCPHCKDHEKSLQLSINADGSAVWKCYRAKCNWTGCVRPSNSERIIKQERIYKLPDPLQYTGKYSPECIKYYQSRGISVRALQSVGAVDTRQYFKDIGQHSCIAFPANYNAKTYFYKFRAYNSPTNKEMSASKDAEQIPLGLDAVQTAKTKGTEIDYLYIVEGEIDMLTFRELGYQYVISVPSGATSGADHILNAHAKGVFSHVKTFILAGDLDEPGLAMRDDIARRIGFEHCRFVQWPEYAQNGVLTQAKDANESLCGAGVEATLKAIKSPKAFPIDGLANFTDLFAEFDVYRDAVAVKYYDTGLPCDDLLKWKKGEQLTVVSAPPNSAKSDFVFNVSLRLAARHGFRFAIFSPESGKTLQLLERLCMVALRKQVRRNSSVSSQVCPIASDSDLAQVRDFIAAHFFPYTVDAGMDTDQFLKIGRQAIAVHGVHSVICDPYNYLTDAYDASAISTSLTKNLQRIRMFARQNNAHLIVVAHPNASGGLNGGQAWANTADNIFWLTTLRDDIENPDPEAIKSREDQENTALGWNIRVETQKIKEREAGQRSKVVCAYERATGAFGVPNIEGASHFEDYFTFRLNSIHSEVTPFDNQPAPRVVYDEEPLPF